MPLRELTAGQEEQEKEEEGEAKDVASLADGFNIIITLVSTLDSFSHTLASQILDFPVKIHAPDCI